VWHACAFYDRDWFILFTDQSLLDGCFSGFPVFLGLFTETLREPVTVGSLFRIRTILTRAIIVSVFAPVALFGTSDIAVRNDSSIRSLVKETSRFFRWTWSAKS
jgi:cbb3-type cytochrome oxidase subunit 1